MHTMKTYPYLKLIDTSHSLRTNHSTIVHLPTQHSSATRQSLVDHSGHLSMAMDTHWNWNIPLLGGLVMKNVGQAPPPFSKTVALIIPNNLSTYQVFSSQKILPTVTGIKNVEKWIAAIRICVLLQWSIESIFCVLLQWSIESIFCVQWFIHLGIKYN